MWIVMYVAMAASASAMMTWMTDPAPVAQSVEGQNRPISKTLEEDWD